ncbi:hypothetical protein QJQ45_023655 [Haematococcus lacustris]|nr:hypothetical protein QJQ45_023655 [Haematococcus lacustris]
MGFNITLYLVAQQEIHELEDDMAEVSMERHRYATQLVVFFGAVSIGTGGGLGGAAVLRACCKVVCRPRGAGQQRGRVVLVDAHRHSRGVLSAAVQDSAPPRLFHISRSPMWTDLDDSSSSAGDSSASESSSNSNDVTVTGCTLPDDAAQGSHHLIATLNLDAPSLRPCPAPRACCDSSARCRFTRCSPKSPTSRAPAVCTSPRTSPAALHELSAVLVRQLGGRPHLSPRQQALLMRAVVQREEAELQAAPPVVLLPCLPL